MRIASFCLLSLIWDFMDLKKFIIRFFCLVIIFALVIGYNLSVYLTIFFLNKKETTLWQKFINFIGKFLQKSFVFSIIFRIFAS